MRLPKTPSSAFVDRRRALVRSLKSAALFAAGRPLPRNYRANLYPFRATSHFLYFIGRSIPGAMLLFASGAATLFVDPPDPGDALWHGPRPTLDALGAALSLEVRSVAELPAALDAALAAHGAVATLPPQDADTAAEIARLLGRSIAAGSGDALTSDADAALAEAMIALRLRHDAAAVSQLRAAAAISAEAHVAAMRATRNETTEAAIVAVMLGVLRGAGLEDAYGPIVSVRGEVLHNEAHDGALAAGDLLLADVGGEVPEGWAADITRVWPVSGKFTPTQRTMYDVVLAAQTAAIEAARPGRRYRDVHETAKRVLVDGLRSVGIFRGDVDGLLERGAAALFFPHGVGHLLGLDVHDMEDLGDRAGYAPGRTRSPRFGDRFLRLDRDLVPGMAVTIEPGFYQVPAILGDASLTGPLGADFDRAALARFADVRGIRIEDDVLVTERGPEVLSSGVPKTADAIESLVGG